MVCRIITGVVLPVPAYREYAAYLWFERFVDAVFIIDILLNFVTSFVDHEVEGAPAKLTRRRWVLVVLDVLSSIRRRRSSATCGSCTCAGSRSSC